MTKFASVVTITLIGFGNSIASAANFYVSVTGNDSNPGTIAAPWQTIAKANQELRPGDTVIVRAGEYRDPINPGNSGAQGQPIRYVAASGELAVISNPAPPSGSKRTAIFLQNRNYIEVDGLRVDGKQLSSGGQGSNVDTFMHLENSSFNVIQNCSFQYANGWDGVILFDGSNYNRFINNTFDAVGTNHIPTGLKAGDDYGDTFVIKDASFNLIVGNRFSRGGHNSLDLVGSYNVIRANDFDGAWTGTASPGSRAGGDISGNSKFSVPGPRGYNLFEYNTVRNAGSSGDATKNSGIKVQGINQIVRGNFFFDNDFFAIKGETRQGSIHNNQHNRIYNNTFYNNDSLFVYRDYGYTLPFFDNVWKNNLVANQRAAEQAFINIGSQAAASGDQTYGVQETTIAGNLFEATTAGTVRFTIAVNGSLVGQTIDWFQNRHPQHIYSNNVAQITFVNAAARTPAGFDVPAGSPAVDAGTSLTNASTSGSGTSITIEDARYFYDGFGIPGETGDLIIVGSNSPVEVISVNYGSNELVISRSITWSSGDDVNLVYTGSAPDAGAHELIDGQDVAQQPAPRPMPPSFVQVE